MKKTRFLRISDASGVRKRKLWRKTLAAADLIARIPGYLASRRRRRRFDNILMLGYNCELAFRAVCSWGGVDSGPFNWSACTSLDGLIAALRVFDDIGCRGWDEFCVGNPLHVCKVTKVGFHGRAKTEELFIDGKIDGKAMAADREELESRLAYLKEKFLRQLRDEKPTLVMYKAWTRDCKPGIAEKIVALKQQLEAMGGRNFEVLAVCEEECAPAFGTYCGFMLRTVKKYNPNSDVTAYKLGDPFGWKILFTEFVPAVRAAVRKDKKFKFQ